MKRSSVFGFCVGLLLLALIGGSLLMLGLFRNTERAVEAAAVGGDVEGGTVLERFPPSGPDETARALQSITAPLGLTLLRESDLTDHPTEEPTTAAKVQSERNKRFLQRLRSAEHRLDLPVPSDISTFLEEHENSIRQASRVLAGQVPNWGLDISAGSLVETPDYQGLLGLSRLLILAAHSSAQKGSVQEADDHLEAAWNLATSLRERPLLIDQVIRQFLLVDVQAHLRHSKRPSERWLSRLRAVDLRHESVEALHLENWLVAQSARNGKLTQTAPWPWSTSPGRFLSAFPILRAQHATARDIATEDPRDFDVESFVEARIRRPTFPYPRSVVARIARTNLETWPGINHRQLGLELTGHVLEVRHKLCRDGLLREESFPSAISPELRWIVEGREQVTIRLSEDFPRQPVAALALQFEVSPGNCPQRLVGLASL